jgi:hypothetical protein
VAEELDGVKVPMMVDPVVDLAEETLTTVVMVLNHHNQETQELTDMEILEDQDNILTTVQVVAELVTADNQDLQDQVVSEEAVEMEEQIKLQEQRDQAAVAADLGVEHLQAETAEVEVDHLTHIQDNQELITSAVAEVAVAKVKVPALLVELDLL